MVEVFQIPLKEENFDYDLIQKNPNSFFDYPCFPCLPLEIIFPQLSFGNINGIDLENMKDIIIDKTDINIDQANNMENNDLLYFIKNRESTNSDESKSTDNTINNSIQIQNKEKEKEKEDEILDQKKIHFFTFLRKKRGRKVSKKNHELSKKYHNDEDFDNLQRKIQVHYINFLLSFANDIIINFFGKQKNLMFKDIRYDLKKIVNHEKVEYLKQCKFNASLKISSNRIYLLKIKNLVKTLIKIYIHIYANYHGN